MNARQVEKKVNAIIDEILNEDQENDFATGDEACPGGCEKLDDTPKECKCGVETSLRFSLRVMEAMRLLQRDVDQPITFSAEEIADYIRSHYHYNGDLYAQVRTALRQVCSQGFVMELLDNEYHLVGPVVRPIKRNGCSLDRIIKDTSRRRKKVDDQRNSVCDCARFPKSPRQDLRSPREESRRTFIVDRPEDSEPIFHSTRISANERDDADRRREFDTVSDIQDYRRRRDIEMEQRDHYAEPIPESSRKVLRISSKVLRISSSDPARNAKKARVKDQRVERADEKEDETTTKEEDMDCTCNAEIVTRDKLARIRPPDRPRVIRNERRRNDAEEDEEDIEERIKDDEEDEDTEDSIYDELRARVPHRRTAARERELRRWIRRCREECVRRGRR
ncbi:hypothetical protein ALC56_04761 [Trachymyrmex septentrionalis]|uniref:Uncharacterized protein n=1 Tax=Trachymyrmex septentrionalis TaxID=34720 RepID=A0A195FJN3_9HYME|nr:hypothetical protein ALC56_04761 [Trachymyrmex septentrionalis]